MNISGRMKKRKGSALVTGMQAWRIKLMAGITLLRISFDTFHKPVPSLKALRLLLGQRKRLHGNRRDHKIVKSGSHYFWSIYTPGFPSEGFNSMARSELKRAFEPAATDIPLQTLILSISSRCHYQCEHCFEGANLVNWEHLTIADLAKVVREAIAMGIPHMQISGGEPMLRFQDLVKLLELGKGKMEFWLSTSGYGLTLEKAWDMKVAGLTGVSISLDHWEPDDHNRFRKHPEAFRWAMEAVENCKTAGIIPSLTLCVTRAMAGEAQLMRYMTLARNLDIPFVRFLEAQKAGNYAAKDVLLNKEEQAAVQDFYLMMNGRSGYRSYPIIQYPGYHQRKLGCYGAGNRYIHIDAQGNYHSCPFCRGETGNIREVELKVAIRLLREKGCQLFKTNPDA